jgi:DNA ligase-1
MAKREFLMLAHKYDPRKHRGQYCWSIKLDGIRAFWDGGITRAKRVPWAEHLATGLWSRYMHVIHAPTWFLDSLPPLPLDGELWLGPGQFQTVSSIVRRHEPDARWRQIKYMVFDFPGLDTVFNYGLIDNPHANYHFTEKDRVLLSMWARDRSVPWAESARFSPVFDELITENKNLQLVKQNPFEPGMEDMILPDLLAQGHEGIVLRKVGSLWLPERSHSLLKIKPWLDDEATVVGCTFGLGKLKGMMGAMIVDWNGHRFQLSGFTDAERRIVDTSSNGCGPGGLDAQRYAALHEGEVAPEHIMPEQFPRGSRVTFKYRELSDDGIPKEARYWRVR